MVAQSKNSPFVVNTATEFKTTITTFGNNAFQRGMFQAISVPVLSDVIAIFF
jgi:hypothetical protein